MGTAGFAVALGFVPSGQLGAAGTQSTGLKIGALNKHQELISPCTLLIFQVTSGGSEGVGLVLATLLAVQGAIQRCCHQGSLAPRTLLPRHPFLAVQNGLGGWHREQRADEPPALCGPAVPVPLLIPALCGHSSHTAGYKFSLCPAAASPVPHAGIPIRQRGLVPAARVSEGSGGTGAHSELARCWQVTQHQRLHSSDREAAPS